MRLQVEAVLRSAAFAMLLSVHAAAPALAQTQCDEHAFSVQIDRTAQALRALNRDSQTRFQERLDAIAKARALTDEQKADIAAAAMDDGKLAQFNGEIEELIAELDTLSATPESQVPCARLEDLKRVRDKLLTVMGRKSGFVLAELEPQNAPATPASEPPSVDVVAKGDAVQPLTPPAQARLVPESPSQVRPAPQPPSPASWSVNLTPAPPIGRAHV